MVQTDNIKPTDKERIIVIGGPTCVGKSDYAVKVALEIGGEVINADSVQIYKGLDIGSGKLTQEEMRGVPHHLMDIVDPSDDSYTVALYIRQAKSTITDIISRGKWPIIVGGTGFYINALLHGYNCGNAGPNHELRRRLEGLEKKYGTGYLFDMLCEIEKDTQIHENDKVRIIRRLELLLSPSSDTDGSTNVYHNAYDALFILMDADRAALDDRAARRIDGMFKAGIMDEVKGLSAYYDRRCMESVGYREIVEGIALGRTENEIKEDMRLSYHKLIKKQQTFFKWLQWNGKVVLMNWKTTEADKRIAEFVARGA